MGLTGSASFKFTIPSKGTSDLEATFFFSLIGECAMVSMGCVRSSLLEEVPALTCSKNRSQHFHSPVGTKFLEMSLE